MGFSEVLQKAVVDLENKRESYNEVCLEYEEQAYQELRKAEEHLREVIRKSKEEYLNAK